MDFRASDLCFRDASTQEELGPAPLVASIPAGAWIYGAVSDPIDFAAIGRDVWLSLLIKVTGTTVGVSVVSEDGSAILSEEVEAGASPHLRAVMIRVTPAAGRGLILLRNYEAEDQAGTAKIHALQVLDTSDSKAALMAAIKPVFLYDWYEQQHPEIDFSNRDALAHFIETGGAQGDDPNPYFDSQWYAQQYLDVTVKGLAPLEYYLSEGGLRGDDPSPDFHGQWYLDHDPSMKLRGQTPLEHYLTIGRSQGWAIKPAGVGAVPRTLKPGNASTLGFRDASTWEELGSAPLVAKIPAVAWTYGAASHPIDFVALGRDVWLYLAIKVTGTTVGVSVVSEDGSAILGEEVAQGPGPHLRAVMIRVAPVVGCGLLLLRNYGAEEQGGAAEVQALYILDASDSRAVLMAAVKPVFLYDWYEEQHPEIDFSSRDALAYFVEVGAAQGDDPNPYFHSQWYAQRYPEATADGLTPLEFYLAEGGLRGDDPSPSFHGQWYLDQDPNMRLRGQTPLEHYLTVGSTQGWTTSPPGMGAVTAAQMQPMNSVDPVDPEEWLAQFEDEQNHRAARSAIFDLITVHDRDREVGGVIFAGSEPATPPPLEDSPAPYVAEIRDVMVQGGGTLLITNDGKAVHDELEFSRLHFPSDSKSRFIEQLPERRVLIGAPDTYAPQEAAGIHLMNEADANYFHWVVEILPRLLALEQSGVLDSLAADLPLLITEGLDPRVVDLLGYVLTDKRPILYLQRERFYKFDRLIFTGAVTRMLNNYHEPATRLAVAMPFDLLAQISARVRDRVGLVPLAHGRRVYLRRSGAARVLVNQDEIQDRLIDAGFEIIDPLHLSARAQVQLFSQCEQIIAPTGAALANLLWCTPGARITVLYPDHEAMNLEVWKEVALAAGCESEHILCPRTYEVVGPYGVHDNYTLPMEWLPRFL